MKILYVATISNTVNTFLIPHIKMLVKEGHQVDVAFNIVEEVDPELYKMGCKVHEIPLQRTPFSRENIKAYKVLKKIVINEKYCLIHTHTPVASAIARLVCRNLKDIKVFYTAHGFHFYNGAPLKNWLLYYPMERWLARYTDVLIVMNKEDYKRAKGFKAKKVEYVSGVGVDLEKLNRIKVNKELKSKELNLPKDAFIVLSVGELNKNKNHAVIIKAIAKMNNPEIHYIICGQGQFENYLKKLSMELGIEKQIHMVGFRKDVVEICKISDIFVFPSFREGLSVALMEAMANGLPVVCSAIRGNSDLIEGGKGGYLVEADGVDEFARYILKMIVDEQLRKSFVRFNLDKIKQYSISNVLHDMERIYFEQN